MITRITERWRTRLLWIIGIALLALSTLLIALPFVLWRCEPYHPLEIWVVDKTVPYTDFREHAGLFWLLDNNKIAKPDTKKLYNVRTDYYGFYPVSNSPANYEWRSNSLPETSKKPDLIYIADTYGVYRDDYMQKKSPEDNSSLLYGGLDGNDCKIIQSALGQGNTFIAEFNTAASPTNAKNRDLLGRLIGLSWRGWIGNYYDDLAPHGSVPAWIVQNWESALNQKWTFSGRGIVLLNERGDIEVLTEKEDISPKGMKMVLNAPWDSEIGVKKPVSYRYWFEWVTADPLLEEVAHYELNLKPEGKKKLDRLNLPTTFPAIVRYKNEQYTSWYFAGDFADIQFSGTPYRVKGIQAIKRILTDETVEDNSCFFWKAYAPIMNYILEENRKQRAEFNAIQKPIEVRVPVRAIREGFQLTSPSGDWNTIFVRSVNLGTAEPGKFFTEFPNEIDTYLRWLAMIADMGANTVRIYTLLPPEFYRALAIYNMTHSEATLLLLQEIWPEEHPPGNDFLQPLYQEAFKKEIGYVIDAVYGRANIPERKGRAWGIYSTDVSKWLLGWLVGRELESVEVLQTDANHQGIAYAGKFISAGKAASATEVWLAESLDAVSIIEYESYQTLHPVGIVSWPTLDPIQHDTEWDPITGKKNRWNDCSSIQIEHLETSPLMTAGLFGAYHIYPNYPDFIVNEPSYNLYKDSVGILRYGGYLEEFIKTHVRYPAIVAEFGIANGAGVAHLSPDGLHHGGSDEATAGRDILRMYDAIQKTGYTGASIFEFMDEWPKKTWIQEPFMIPFDRRVLWHNAVDPEQNYGLIANESIAPTAPEKTIQGSGALMQLDIAHDATYLYLTATLSADNLINGNEILIGIDTYKRAVGQMAWPRGLGTTASGMEFLLEIKPQEMRLQVIPSYNIARARYASTLMHSGAFSDIDMLVNGKVITKDGTIIPEKRFNASILRQGEFDESGNLWNVQGNILRVRIPWNRLNVTDPSSLKVLDDSRSIDNPVTDQLKTIVTDGFVFDALVLDSTSGKVIGKLEANIDAPYIWSGWEDTPPYCERLKKSYFIVRDLWGAQAEEEMTIRKEFIEAQSGR